MRVIAFIFARGGSKSLLGKNLRLLGGRPLIGWSIAHAMSVSRIKRVIVSTDCPEIAEVALKEGAEVPFLRPQELARDDSPEWFSWRHALKFIGEEEGSLPDVMVSLPPTSPLRAPSDIENCLDEYEKGNADIIITVTDSNRSPYFNMVKINDDGSTGLVLPPSHPFARRQDVPIVYDMTTVAYVARPEFILTKGSIFEGRVKHVHVPQERAIDIDNQIDFTLAECLFDAL